MKSIELNVEEIKQFQQLGLRDVAAFFNSLRNNGKNQIVDQRIHVERWYLNNLTTNTSRWLPKYESVSDMQVGWAYSKFHPGEVCDICRGRRPPERRLEKGLFREPDSVGEGRTQDFTLLVTSNTRAEQIGGELDC
jgi:hypothetical protein